MREYNFAIILVALVMNTVINVVALATELINSIELFLLIWFVPTCVTLAWASILYHKSD